MAWRAAPAANGSAAGGSGRQGAPPELRGGRMRERPERSAVRAGRELQGAL